MAFAQFPTDSPKAGVLTFVAHTPQATDALLDAAVPQTAAIRRDAGANLTVAYDGPPQFQPIPQCPGLTYATNTPVSVLAFSGTLYCCHQAVWYQAAAAAGPWTVSTTVPDVIYSIPPQNPLYNATYVHVYDAQAEYVDEGYTPGYTGTYADGPTVVDGTGYDYAAWSGNAYFPQPQTFGFDADYDSDLGVWGFDDDFSGGYGIGWFGTSWGYGGWWRHHPESRWGAHRWWGQGGYLNRRDIEGRLGEAGGYSRGAGRDGRADLIPHLPGAVEHGAGWHNLYARLGNAGRNMALAQADRHRQATPVAGQANDVFAGRDGSVYRRSDGGWQRRVDGGGSPGHAQDWSAYGRTPEAEPHYEYQPPRSGGFNDGAYGRPEAGLERDFGARSRGTARAFSEAVSRGGGGFRGGGGGGGGRR